MKFTDVAFHNHLHQWPSRPSSVTKSEPVAGENGISARRERSDQVMKLERVEPLVARFLGLEPEVMDAHFYPASREDLPQIVRLRQTMVEQPAARDRDYLQWRYRFPRRSVHDCLDENRLWIFSRHGVILGLVGIESRNLRIKGRTVPTFKVMDLMVKPEVDRKGLGVWMQLKLQNLGRPVVALGSNRNSLGIVSKLFVRLPNQRVYKSMLESSHYFGTRLRNRLLAGVSSILYDMAVAPLMIFRGLIYGRHRCRAEPISRFTPADDRTLRHMNGCDIQFERNAGYLNWRLVTNPRDRVRIIGIRDGITLTGYFAFAVRDRPDSTSTRREAFLLDWGVLPDKRSKRQWVGALIDCQIRLRRAGVESVSAFGYDRHSDRLLRRSGFYLRDDDTKTVSLFSDDPQLLQILTDSGEWFLTGADTDYA